LRHQYQRAGVGVADGEAQVRGATGADEPGLVVGGEGGGCPELLVAGLAGGAEGLAGCGKGSRPGTEDGRRGFVRDHALLLADLLTGCGLCPQGGASVLTSAGWSSSGPRGADQRSTESRATEDSRPGGASVLTSADWGGSGPRGADQRSTESRATRLWRFTRRSQRLVPDDVEFQAGEISEQFP
jgi:hypothetical protein